MSKTKAVTGTVQSTVPFVIVPDSGQGYSMGYRLVLPQSARTSLFKVGAHVSYIDAGDEFELRHAPVPKVKLPTLPKSKFPSSVRVDRRTTHNLLSVRVTWPSGDSYYLRSSYSGDTITAAGPTASTRPDLHKSLWKSFQSALKLKSANYGKLFDRIEAFAKGSLSAEQFVENFDRAVR